MSLYGKSPNRGNLIIELNFADPRWEASREHEVDKGRLENGSPHGEGAENLAITPESELDLKVEYRLRCLCSWDRMDIVLSQRSRKNRSWRSSTTKLLEVYLGPNLSKDKRQLTFRPIIFPD